MAQHDHLLEHVRREFGERGRRCIEFLETADMLLDAAGQGDKAPRLPETVAYCLREALKELPQAAELGDAGEWAQLSRRVIADKDGLLHASAEEDRDTLMDRLVASIEDLERFHEQERVHQRRLLEVIRTRTAADLLRRARDPVTEYQDLLTELDRAAHGSADLDRAVALRRDAYHMLERVFPPPELPLQVLRDLASVEEPTDQDRDRLLDIVTSPHHLDFFFSQDPTTRWLSLLQPTGLIDPPNEGVWPVLRLVERHRTNPDGWLLNWLQGRVREARDDASLAAYCANAARMLAVGGHAMLLQLLAKHPDHEWVAFNVERAVRETDATSSFVSDAADLLLNPGGPLARRGRANRLLATIVDGTEPNNATRRLELLRFKINNWLASMEPWQGPSPNHSATFYSRGDEVPQLLVGAYLDVAHKALTCGVDITDLVADANSLHQDLADRVRVAILVAAGTAPAHAIIDALAESICTRFPTDDDLIVVDRLIEAGDADALVAAGAAAMGPAPDPQEVANKATAQDIPLGWLYRLWWAAVLPDDATTSWADALEELSAAVGTVSLDLIKEQARRPRAWAWTPTPPMSLEELQGQPPEDAATVIAAWRPEGPDDDQAIFRLAQQLKEAVKKNAAAWAAQALGLVKILRHPAHIHAMFAGLRQARTDLSHAGDTLIDAVVAVSQHPWDTPTPTPAGDSSSSWDETIAEGVALLGERAAIVATADGYGEALDLAVRLAEQRADPRDAPSASPFHAAIALPHTRALDAALRLGAFYASGGGEYPASVLQLVERILVADSTSMLPERALLAVHVRTFERWAGSWLDEHGDEIFPANEVGRMAMEAAITWAPPSPWLHRHKPHLVDDACRVDVPNAVEQLLVMMLTDPTSFEPGNMAERLRRNGPEALPQSGLGLVRVLGDKPTGEWLVTAGKFWDAVLDLEPPGAHLRSFGWLVELDFEDERWCERMRRTADAAAGDLDVAYKVADRAAQIPNADALQLITRLLRGPLQAWDRREVGTAGLQLLASTVSVPGVEVPRRALRTTLLEQGFTAALDQEASGA